MRRSKYPTDLSDAEWKCLEGRTPDHRTHIAVECYDSKKEGTACCVRGTVLLKMLFNGKVAGGKALTDVRARLYNMRNARYTT